VTDANGPPVLHVVLCSDLSLLTLCTSDQQAQNNQNLCIVAPLASVALYTTVHNYCLSTRSTPLQMSPTQLKLSISQRQTPNRKLPICFGTATSLPICLLNNTSYFQQFRVRMRNKRGWIKLYSVGLHVLHSPSSIIQATELRRIGCEDVKL